ncbi:MAG TPA: TonB family protein [Candidatus Sulfotelmatobacter sp.]
MPITQIPFQDPVAPAEKPLPEQLGLYDARDWETAYRDPDANIPHLLIQLQDDLSRSRRREAAWISIIAHLVLFILLWNLPLIEKYLPWHPLVVVSQKDLTKDKDVTFLALPPDAQKLAHRPKTNIASDKDRIATSRRPELDPRELRKILASPPPGAPGMTGPRAPQPAPQQPPAVAQNQPPQPQQGQQATHPPSDQNLQARLQMPARPSSQVNSFAKYAGSMRAGEAVQQAAQAAAASRAAGQGGQGGDFGLGRGAHGRPLGALDILSDTQGVDFGPYLQRILEDVRQNWYLLIPPSADMKKGKLAIEFAITKDGKVAGMKLVATSGDTALDRAAWGGITASDPFPPLPTDFTGQYLALRFRFYYNPDKGEMEQQ